MRFDEDHNTVGGLVPKFGAIFMSNGATKKECLKRKIFGLPMAQANFVKQVKSGMILFLFEYEKRELYGVFQATSDGIMNLYPRAFNSSGKQFPAQVQITPIWSCHPLPESVFRDAIKENYYSPNKFNFGLSAKQVRALLHLFNSRRSEGKANFGRNPGMGINSTDFHWTKKRKMDDHGRFPSRDALESEVLDYWPRWHARSADCDGDTLDTINSASDATFLLNSRFSTEEEGNANFGRSHGMGINSPDYHWTKKRNMDDDGKFPSHDASESEVLHSWPPWHATSADCGGNTLGAINSAAEPDSTFLLNRRISTEHIDNSPLGLVGADRESLVVEESFKSVNNNGGGIEPDFLPVFPSYFALSEDIVVANAYRFSKDDGVENACDVESCIRPNFTLGLVSNDAPDRTVPYDPEFPDIQYQCSSQIMDSAQDFSSHQVPDENFLPLSTSECVTHEAPLGSLYSEAPVVKASVFSRLSVAPLKPKKENKSIHNKDDRLSSIDEIMDSLHQAHNRWVKGSVRAKSRYVYVRCEEESKFLNQLQVEQPVVKKEMTADDDCLVEEESDVPKETRVVDFKRRSEKSKYLDEMISNDSAGTTMGRTLKKTVDATDEHLAGKAGKRRKLIRPDFKIEQSHERDDILGKSEGKEKIDEINSQVASGANDCEQNSSLQLGSENQANLPIQNLASSLSSDSSAQVQPSFTSSVAVDPKNLEGEETEDINHQVKFVKKIDITPMPYSRYECISAQGIVRFDTSSLYLSFFPSKYYRIQASVCVWNENLEEGLLLITNSTLPPLLKDKIAMHSRLLLKLVFRVA
ncbi:hypothetical protein POM88_034214 [Heracleum sosnowskyi]|uniref:DCD domain-containing protein n=1 Tax=Heracleum sosnowskyi TaxID=360622 RepID=A0AAD8HIU4_9APIA|nr:hypothetical protein POM88_034214 [Heracleum sosnowskyi]